MIIFNKKLDAYVSNATTSKVSNTANTTTSNLNNKCSGYSPIIGDLIALGPGPCSQSYPPTTTLAYACIAL